MLKRNKKTISILVLASLTIAVIYAAWQFFAAPTRVALVNFPSFMSASLRLSNSDRFIIYEELAADSLKNLGRYDFVLGFGMGMKIPAEQRQLLQKHMDKGFPVMVYAATSPENKISTLDSIRQERIENYLNNANKKNYQSMARFIRVDIDRKKLFVSNPDSVVESPSDVLYHLDEERWFSSVDAYRNYLKEIGTYRSDAPKIAMMGGFNQPFSGNRANIDSTIIAFERAGFNIYPILSGSKRIEFLKEINPDAVLYFPHGRLAMGQGDEAVHWLKERNIPLFAPLSILDSQKEWENNPMGIFGGILSQSVVMPELDGAIYPYVLNVQNIDKEGLYRFQSIPERLKTFSKIVSNFIELKKKANADKKVAIFYFKGPGQSAFAAQGLETAPSLHKLLLRLKSEGYRVDNLPEDAAVFEGMLMRQGIVFSTYAEGAFDDFLKQGNPLLIEKHDYEAWAKQSMPAASYKQVTEVYGEAPGAYMALSKDDKKYLAVAAVQFGNIALLPQPMAGLGSDGFAIVHGAKSPPPHSYIAPYLWSRYAFEADALMHFGTHGSLEFTPQKQVALSNSDWGDILVGQLPHFYYYTIGNIGESIIAKRRSYATLVSYLTPSFSESKTRNQYKSLTDAINGYYKADDAVKEKASLRVKRIAVDMGLHRDLRLDSSRVRPYSEDDILLLENFAEEIASEKMSGTFYITGIPYSPEKINSTVMAMSADPIAYSLAALDRMRGRISEKELKSKTFFTQRYLNPAKVIVTQLLKGTKADSFYVAKTAGIAPHEIAVAKTILTPPDRMAMMRAAMAMAGSQGKSASKGGGHPAFIPKIGKRPEHSQVKQKQHPDSMKAALHRAGIAVKEYTPEEKARARAIVEIERTLSNVSAYKKALEESPEMELESIINALAGGYVPPSSGGDAVANPTALPTGRNLYSINAEATPSELAWDKGVALVNTTIEQYRKQHKGAYPRKVSYTFWSSEFIESEGATIAQVLYMLGVEPVRDLFGRVADLQLIPSERLGRPRIDVIIQTSGQFRDLAASRLELISRAVKMVSEADEKEEDNFVKTSSVEVERQLVEQGLPPKNARELSTRRVFGGINGMYGTGIQEMITSSDKWENEAEIAEVYLNNMGASYGDEKTWGEFDKGLLRAVLHNTDAVVQPRQSNTWGALSLDHVYEFMGGMNLTIRNVTGKDPDAFFADYRNRNNFRVQELKEAIGVEARSTIFNPEFVKELIQGGRSSAARIEEVVTNTFGWNVSKPDVIDNEMWDRIYQIYVKDQFELKVQAFFERENPAALQEITAIMLESSRKGMWKATPEQLASIAALHTDLTQKYGATGKGFSGGNKKLQDFIAQKVDTDQANRYRQALKQVEQASDVISETKNSMVLKKEQLSELQNGNKNVLNGLLIGVIAVIAFAGILMLVRKRRKN